MLGVTLGVDVHGVERIQPLHEGQQRVERLGTQGFRRCDEHVQATVRQLPAPGQRWSALAAHPQEAHRHRVQIDGFRIGWIIPRRRGAPAPHRRGQQQKNQEEGGNFHQVSGSSEGAWIAPVVAVDHASPLHPVPALFTRTVRTLRG